MDDVNAPKCGVVVTDISGREWICVKKVHAKVYKRRRRGGIIWDQNPVADQHYFVVRYPNRKKG